ncbi:MAG: PilZ domain-containing protein [Bradymonadales bacterium]|nr:MAG: PilZ domain-containing protein [Bradymonadales bacterium]
MKSRRKWDRYKVKSSPRVLKARVLEGLDRNSSIYSLSLGGCGFLSSRLDAKLLLQPQVKVELSFCDERLVLDGIVQYCQMIPDSKKLQNILGIQFQWRDSSQAELFKRLVGAACDKGELQVELLSPA